MKPTAFEFKVTLPGDARLVGAIKGLTAHAAGYAHLGDTARAGLASQVAAATEAAIAAAPAKRAPIVVRFFADEEALTVAISFESAGASPESPSTAAGGATVEWMTEGARRVCRIRQPLPA